MTQVLDCSNCGLNPRSVSSLSATLFALTVKQKEPGIVHPEIKVLDFGYIKLIESWGSDERIIEAARMSTDKGFLGWGEPEKPGDEKLLGYLYRNNHATPFEMAGCIIEVQAPIFVFREWHRHRTQCAHPDTLVHFDAPKSRENRRSVYKLRIEDIWKKWQPTTRSARPERQVNALWPRSRIQAMQLRNLDEEAKEFGHSAITDVIRGEPKEMVRVTTTSGRSVALTRDHRVLTSTGWMRLGDAIKSGSLLTLEGTTADARASNLEWGTSKENAQDRVDADRNQRLVPAFEEIAEVRKLGVVPTFDLAVVGPWHNFVADGFVVHNSFNEMSARYTPLPDLNYIPTVERLLINSKTNKQAGVIKGADELDEVSATAYQVDLSLMYENQQRFYEKSLQMGVPKELARNHLPVGRYSKMRASACLRNWLGFLTLRMAPGAQWEIREYARELHDILKPLFPRTLELFNER